MCIRDSLHVARVFDVELRLPVLSRQVQGENPSVRADVERELRSGNAAIGAKFKNAARADFLQQDAERHGFDERDGMGHFGKKAGGDFQRPGTLVNEFGQRERRQAQMCIRDSACPAVNSGTVSTMG